ncbi:hypothetical protein K9M74_00470 [Candidatus Woesearchaeota archaeon]|nr:hypothetical protein [Candidatus Woesearchaeota archaeon]
MKRGVVLALVVVLLLFTNTVLGVDPAPETPGEITTPPVPDANDTDTTITPSSSSSSRNNNNVEYNDSTIYPDDNFTLISSALGTSGEYTAATTDVVTDTNALSDSIVSGDNDVDATDNAYDTDSSETNSQMTSFSGLTLILIVIVVVLVLGFAGFLIYFFHSKKSIQATNQAQATNPTQSMNQTQAEGLGQVEVSFELTQYVLSCQAANIPKEQLFQILLENGYDAETANAALQQYVVHS